jgi:hypothetical protein
MPLSKRAPLDRLTEGRRACTAAQPRQITSWDWGARLYPVSVKLTIPPARVWPGGLRFCLDWRPGPPAGRLDRLEAFAGSALKCTRNASGAIRASLSGDRCSDSAGVACVCEIEHYEVSLSASGRNAKVALSRPESSRLGRLSGGSCCRLQCANPSWCTQSVSCAGIVGVYVVAHCASHY